LFSYAVYLVLESVRFLLKSRLVQVENYVPQIAACLIGGSLLIATGLLGLYHLMLISRNETTYERIKGIYHGSSPYDKGCCRNWYQCCSGTRSGYCLNPTDLMTTE